MAIAFVQDDVVVESASASTIVKAFGSNVTAGNALWVGVTWSDADATPTVSDSLGNTYTEIGTHTHTGSGGGAGMSVFYAKNITGGACTVTANYGGNRSFREMFILEFSGAHTTDPFDDTNLTAEGTAGGAGEATSGAVLPDQNDSLLIGFISSVSGMGTAAPRAGQGWTELIDTTGGGGGFAQYQVKAQTTATSEASLWTVSVSGAGLYNARVMAFRPAASGAFEVAADSGSYTLTGTAAQLEYDRIIVAEGGEYALSGTDAGLFGDFTVAADGGSYAISGSDASLEHTPVGGGGDGGRLWNLYTRKRRR